MSDRAAAGAASASGSTDVVSRYLAAMVVHDWEQVAACLSPTVSRVGPFGDRYAPREPYVAFLAELIPSLEGYQLEVHRIRPLAGGAVAELSETVLIDGASVVTHEALIFDFDQTGVISHIEIFIQRVPGAGRKDPQRGAGGSLPPG